MFNAFIQEIKEKNIKISFSHGKLNYSGPEQHIDKKLIDNLKKYKNKLLKYYWPEECWNMMPINTEGDLTPLVLLHAGPSNYPISEYLGSNRPFYGFFYIGSEGEKIRYKTIEEFASEYLKQMVNVLPEGPYILGGLSIGGHLAYEMAIKLQNKGHNIPLLILVDSALPNSIQKVPKLSLSKRLYENLKKVYYKLYDLTWQIIYGFMTSIFDKIPKEKRNRYIRWRYKQLIMKYKPTEEFKGDILLFKAKETNIGNQYFGWDRVCKNINVITFEGNHSAMYDDQESVNIIKENIAEWINNNEESNGKKAVS